MRNSLKIISLGGFGEVTRNMFVYELGKEILLVDCGIGFPTEEMLGVDVLVPDISYLKGKEKQIRGMILTHGHEDHIGALPYILPNLPNFPIYGAKLTAAFAEDKLREHSIGRRIQVVNSQSKLQMGPFRVDFVRVTHAVSDPLHLIIHTPVGVVYHGIDYKFDLTPIDGIRPELGKIAAAGDRGVNLLISDSLGSERKGVTPSEATLNEMFKREMADCQGKFIVTAISSSIPRLQQAIDAAIAQRRKVVLVGKSVEKKARIAMRLGYLKIRPEQIVRVDRASRHPDRTLAFLVAGSQGQIGSALQRMAIDEHRYVKIRPGDKVVFSSPSYIPGTVSTVYAAINALFERGAMVVYSDIRDGLHVSGHGSQYDLKLLIALTKPKFIHPIGGDYRHLVLYSHLAQGMGYRPEQILISRGQALLLDSKGNTRLGEKVAVQNIMVDGLGVGDVGRVVLRDRQLLAEEGVVVAVIEIDKAARELVGEPDLISRGFVFAKKDNKILPQATVGLKKLLMSKKEKLGDVRVVRQYVAFYLQDFFFQKLRRRPMILPVVVEV